jgi:hypothetical protein
MLKSHQRETEHFKLSLLSNEKESSGRRLFIGSDHRQHDFSYPPPKKLSISVSQFSKYNRRKSAGHQLHFNSYKIPII